MKPRFETAAWLLGATCLAPAAAAQLGDTPEKGDRMGSALAQGDFDNDGIGDLAIGVPGESVSVITFPPTTPSSYAGAGAVHLVFGHTAGLTYGAKKLLKQAPATGTQPGLGAGNAYGAALVCLDFDGDGFDDLAVGIPGQKVNGFAGAGAVQLLPGLGHGLDLHAAVLFSQDSPGVPDAAEAGDAFGAALCAGDFDGDGSMELAVGVPAERVGSVTKAGAVNVLGAILPKTGFWTQGAALQDVAEVSDLFGQSLAAGDLNADGFDDLAVGVPEEDLAFPGAGAVHVIYGSVAGLKSTGNQMWHQDSPGIAGAAEAGDNYGFALLAADIDLDGIEDLVVGAPGDMVDGVRAGTANALFGTPAGLSDADNLVLSELDFSPFLETPEEGDRFGSSLAFHGYYNVVTIGIPGEWVGTMPNAGAVMGLGTGPSRTVGFGILMGFSYSPSQPGDGLGSVLATGDFNGDAFEDFAVGVPFKDVSGAADAGEVLITLVAAAPYLEVLHQGP